MMYLCIGPNCWGKGDTIGLAVRGCRSQLPSFHSSLMDYNLYEVHDDAYVNDLGNIRSETPPKKIREVRYSGKQRVVKEKFDGSLP